jgi:hypothetical protein
LKTSPFDAEFNSVSSTSIFRTSTNSAGNICKKYSNLLLTFLTSIPAQTHLQFKLAPSNLNGYKLSLTITDSNGVKLEPNLSINLSTHGGIKNQPDKLNTFFMNIPENKKEEESDDNPDDDPDISF